MPVKRNRNKTAKRVLLSAAAALALILIIVFCFPRIAETPGSTAKPETTPPPTVAQQSSTPVPVATPVPNKGNGGPMIKPVYDDTNRPQYDIHVMYDEKNHSAVANQTIQYTNTVKDSMDEVYLHIYPNHFSKPEYVGLYFSPGRPVYPNNKFNPGSITFTSVKAAGQPAQYAITGSDSTVLRIPLSTPLVKGQTITLELAYSLQVPNRTGRFAWGDTGTAFANWYPIMAMYDKEGWSLDPYYEIGDPFYSETADYKVTIDMPEGMEAAFTGDIVKDATAGGRRTLALSETGVRDFTFILSRKYTIQKQVVDGIEVRVAMPKADKGMMKQVMGYATTALSLYDKKFGKYTNDALTVAFADDYGGMEYPGLVVIQDTLLNTQKNDSYLKTCVVHEIGHQWWYSAVGNDEVEESWLDESLTSFTELVYQYGGKSITGIDLKSIQPTEGKLERAINTYKDWNEFRYVYGFGQEFFVKLMLLMGEDRFYQMLQKYYNNYAYGIATADDLYALVKEMGNDEAVKWYELCVYGKKN